jgi:Kef-type K+ transport system membrane component KefB
MVGLVDEIGRRISQGANAPNLAFLILLATLIVAPMLAGLIRLPAMVGLVLVGMVIGPHGLGILATKPIALTALGDFGLLYLMFNAGLELDLRQLVRNKRVTIAFAFASFAIPFTLGVASAWMLGYAAAAAVLMGSNWGSHTLVTYPMLQKLGLGRNRAVSTVVGATAVTDTSALLVLAGVSVLTRGSGGFAGEIVEMVIGLAILVGWSIFALPRVARWFFVRFGSNTGQRFVFALAAFFFGAILAEASGIDGIVGAFFAGLGLGRAIPIQSPLMERVQFVGASLFVPVFLVSVGILLDPHVLVQPTTLLYALVFTVTVLGGKALAAVVVGRRARYSWAEVGVMSGLSGSQAAATLATTLVGARLHLFDEQTINAVLVVILATLIITPAMVSIFGRKLKAATAAEHETEPLGHTILVPIWGASTQPMLGLASRLAEHDTGFIIASTFVPHRASDAELSQGRKLQADAEEWLAREGLVARAELRVSHSSATGLVETVRGEAATLVVSEWDPDNRLLESDPETLAVLTHPPVPIVLAHGPIDAFDRLIVVVARPEELVPPGQQDLELARELSTRLSRGRPVYVVSAPLGDPINALFGNTPRVDRIGSVDPLGWVRTNARPTDLFVLPGLDEAHAALARSPDVVGRRFMVAIAARPN